MKREMLPLWSFQDIHHFEKIWIGSTQTFQERYKKNKQIEFVFLENQLRLHTLSSIEKYILHRSGPIQFCMRQTMCSPQRWFRPCTNNENFCKTWKMETNHFRWIFLLNTLMILIVNVLCSLFKLMMFFQHEWSKFCWMIRVVSGLWSHYLVHYVAHKVFISNFTNREKDSIFSYIHLNNLSIQGWEKETLI